MLARGGHQPLLVSCWARGGLRLPRSVFDPGRKRTSDTNDRLGKVTLAWTSRPAFVDCQDLFRHPQPPDFTSPRQSRRFLQPARSPTIPPALAPAAAPPPSRLPPAR